MRKSVHVVVLTLLFALAGSVVHAGTLGRLLSIPLTEDEGLWFGDSSKYSLVLFNDVNTIKCKAWLESSRTGVNASFTSAIKNGGKFAIKVTPDPTYVSTDGTKRDVVGFFNVACLVSGDVTKGSFTVLRSSGRSIEVGKPFPIAVGLFGINAYGGDGTIPSDSDLAALLASATSWWVVYCSVL